ncbi:MAG: hypothetical protein RSD14_05495 [Clostridia bacterium]
MTKEIQETLKLYYDLLTPRPLREQLDLLEQAIENITKQKFDLKARMKPTTDREILECIQEAYSLIYCLTNNLEYATFEAREHLDDRYLSWIAEYKMEHFSKEIFQELGMEIIEKNKKGFVVRDTTPKNKLN